MLYFDYAATTPLASSVIDAMTHTLYSPSGWANANSIHSLGRQSKTLINDAQKNVARTIHGEPESIFWTSGATESINLAIKGAADFYQRNGRHIISCVSDHAATLKPLQYLSSVGFEVTLLNVDSNGCLSLSELEKSVRDDTILITLCHVNNELGVIHPLREISQISHSKGVLLHIDATQSIGKIQIDVRDTPVDYMSLSAHKAYGPKGVGVLYIRQHPRRHLTPLIHSSGYQSNIRGGTPANHQIVGMSEAFKIASDEKSQLKVIELSRYLQNKLSKLTIRINAEKSIRVPHIFNITLPPNTNVAHIKDHVFVSSGSACQKGEPSHVLRAIGVSNDEMERTIRISLGIMTSKNEIDQLINIISNSIR